VSRLKKFRLDQLDIPDLEKIPVEIRKHGMREAVKAVARRVREIVPDSGKQKAKPRAKLKTSIRWSVRKQGKEAIVRANARHAHLVHDGTRPHVIRAKNRASAGRAGGLFRRKAMVIPIGGRLVFARSVRHPGAKAQPFLDRAREDSVAEIERILQETAHKSLEDIGKA
jgi:hypothetical protein